MSTDDTGALATETLEEPARFGAGPASEKRVRRGPGSYDRSISQPTRLRGQRSTLILAGARVLAQRGVAHASVALVLEASGLSRGTFYRHFRNLSELFRAVENDAAWLLQAAISAAAVSSAELDDQLREWFRAYLQFCSEYPDLLRVLHREPASGRGEVRRVARASVDRLFRDCLARAVRKGLLRKVPDDITIEALIGGIESVALGYVERDQQHEILEALEPLVRLACRVVV